MPNPEWFGIGTFDLKTNFSDQGDEASLRSPLRGQNLVRTSMLGCSGKTASLNTPVAIEMELIGDFSGDIPSTESSGN